MGKRKNNKVLVAGITFFALWMIPFLILAVMYQNGDGDLKHYALSHLINIKEYFSFAHFANYQEVATTVGCYFLVLLDVLIMLLWFILSIRAKQYKKVMGWLIPIILIISGIEGVASFTPYTGGTASSTATSYFSLINNTSINILTKVLVVLLLLFAFFATLFGIILGFSVIARLSLDIRQAKMDELNETLNKELEEERLAAEAKEAEEQLRKEREAEEIARRNEELRLAKEEAEKQKEEQKMEIVDLIRQVVKEELSKSGVNSTHIVQNFYNYIPDNTPKAKTIEETTEEIVEKVSDRLAEKEEPIKEEPAKEEPVEEAIALDEPIEEASISEPIEEVSPTPLLEKEEPTEITSEEKKPIIRIPFQTRMIDASKEMKDNYNELKNELISWGLKSRISNSGDTFRLHCKTYCKLTIAGKSLKLYLALNPDEYDNTTLPFQNVKDKNIYKEIPLAFKVRSGLSMRRAKALIRDACEIDDLEQDRIPSIDWAEDLKNNYNESDIVDDEEELAEEE